MRGQRGLGRAQRPDVKIVDGLDAVEPAERGLDLVDSIPSGTPISDIPTDSFSRPMLPHRMTHGDREAHHRIDPLLPGPQDHEPGEHHRRRHRRVGRHVQEGARGR